MPKFARPLLIWGARSDHLMREAHSTRHHSGPAEQVGFPTVIAHRAKLGAEPYRAAIQD